MLSVIHAYVDMAGILMGNVLKILSQIVLNIRKISPFASDVAPKQFPQISLQPAITLMEVGLMTMGYHTTPKNV